MQILNGKFDTGEIAQNANGGTEVMARRVASLDKKLLKEFQISISRIEHELDQKKIRIYYAHDLPGDPAADHLKDGGWSKFHKLVFVSNWQMQAYINHYRIPWASCIVMQNAIDPIVFNEKKFESDTIRLFYHTTPHRGLEILVPVFKKLCEKHDNIVLDVYSSFDLYGWGERDEQYKQLIDTCIADPKINYNKSVPNSVIREKLQHAHIFAYPSIWPETSCLCLMEAMSAGLMCVHSNYGALAETSANWTHMYHFIEDYNEHAKTFYTVLHNAIDDVKNSNLVSRLKTQKSYADIFYAWKPGRAVQWDALLRMLLATVKDRQISVPTFVYRTEAA